MAEDSSMFNEENKMDTAFNEDDFNDNNNNKASTAGSAAGPAGPTIDSSKRFQDAHHHKRQKVMNLQGLREWYAASTRGNNLRVGPDGVVRPVVGEAAIGCGSSSRSDAVDSNDNASAGAGAGNSAESSGWWTEPIKHSSPLTKPKMLPPTGPGQKRKIAWDEEMENDAIARGFGEPAANHLPIITSARNHGFHNTWYKTTTAQKSNRSRPYANFHPSRMGNSDPGHVGPYTNLEQKGLQQKFLRNEDMANMDTRRKVIHDVGCTNLGNYAPSQAFSGVEYNSTYSRTDLSKNDKSADITAREASLRRREVLLDISEQSIMNTRTNLLQSIDQVLTVSTETRRGLRVSRSNLFSDESVPAMSPAAGNHRVELFTSRVTGSMEEIVDALLQFEDSVLGIERVLTGQPNRRD